MNGRTEKIAEPCGAQLCGVAFLSKLTVGHRLSRVTRNIVECQGGYAYLFIKSLHKSLLREKRK